MLYNVVDRSFVLVRASWPAGKVRRIVERLQPSHIVVGQDAQEDAYYLFSAPKILDLLATAEDQAPRRWRSAWISAQRRQSSTPMTMS